MIDNQQQTPLEISFAFHPNIHLLCISKCFLIMQNEILAYLNDPRQLEKMYRTNKAHFKQAFTQLYPELKGNLLADCWNERLNYETDEINWGTRRELFFVLIAALIAGNCY